MSGIKIRDLRWEWFEDDTDHATVAMQSSGWRVSGQHGKTRYWLNTDAHGATNSIRVETPWDGETRSLVLRRDAAGWQGFDGVLVPESAMALDPDIACTALINTLPIRRLGLRQGESAEIDMVYIPLPSLLPCVMRQRYSRTERGYHYENLRNGFHAQLTVDSEGWVTDYPGICRLKELPP